MPEIIAVANSKGGVAKTTSCIGLGCALADTGKKTLLIDLDHQGNLSDDLGRGDEDYTITDLFENPKFDTNDLIYAALDDGQEVENLFVIPADITLAVECRSAERYAHRLEILSDGLKRLKTSFDFIIIDCRPAIDLSIENALLIADKILIPVDMDKRATKGISDLLEVVEEIKRTKDFVYSLVYTKVDKRSSKMLASVKSTVENSGWPVCKTEIRISELYKQATNDDRPSFHYARKDRPAEDYAGLAREILEG
ncbi:MAG: cobalamin biosynthesis protein CbiA [Cellvibrionaceae bacterium]|jgi:chromosome partitioning protein|nr:cobalamin biosynthesis protein CbiA [Cellvibrionaceae bacterium]MAZ90336.1 cobalamin biosynthesis protein CbiA [Cellvibrionaceae bacterium]|tara:strand:- start:4811 stop:5572 length:762 start_codon:yes stop_codon:yes gene_type:complete